jgi:PAS domain-containing protein
MHEAAIDYDQLAGVCAAALDALEQQIIICDTETILFVNTTAARMIRAESPSELIGHSIDEVLHPDMQFASAQRRQWVTQSRQQLLGLPTKLVGRDGSTITTMTDSRPIEFDGKVALVVSDHAPTRSDGTVSAPVTGGYASRRTMFEAALEVLPDVLLIHDHHLIVFANAACRRFLAAASPGDLEGRPLDTIIHPDACEADRERRRLMMDGKRPIRSIPVKLVTLDERAKRVVVDAHHLATDHACAFMIIAPASAGS